MKAAVRQLPPEIGGRGSDHGGVPEPRRREARFQNVRRVEYAPYPRVSKDSRLRVGYTRDESASGMCLGVERAEDEGALLRIIVRGADGRPTLDTLTRVVWCRSRGDGRYWIGLAHVAEAQRQLLKVRHSALCRKVEVTA